MEGLFGMAACDRRSDLAPWGLYDALSGTTTPSEPRAKGATSQGSNPPQPVWKAPKGKKLVSPSAAPRNTKLAIAKQCPENAARERSRVRALRQAFLSLQAALPYVPPDTKLSKLDVLVLATSYIAHLTQTLDQEQQLPGDSQILKGPGYLHPMKKWPMRSRLYAGALGQDFSGVSAVCQE